MKKATEKKMPVPAVAVADYSGLLGGVSELLEAARRACARTVNALMTATYWEVGRRIVEFEQGGEKRAGYGTKLIERLSVDLTQRFGRGFGQRNVECMRQFFLAAPPSEMQRKLREFPIPQTVSAESPAGENRATLSLDLGDAAIEQILSAKSHVPSICATPSSISESPIQIFQTLSARAGGQVFKPTAAAKKRKRT